MSNASDLLHGLKIAVVIPAYRVEHEISEVLINIPEYVQYIIVIDDCSPDNTSEVVKHISQKDNRIFLIRHSQNKGVGGAMVSGFKKALELGAEIIIKIDGDGQMDTTYIPLLIFPLIQYRADYTKGNRFRDFVALRQMPFIRRLGNTILGFLSKVSTGYWNIFDPTNGYVAIRRETLAQIPLPNLDNSYFFETSMLAQLYLLNAVVVDVPMPARYGNQPTSMNIHRVLFEFPPRLFSAFIKRVLLKNFLYDFSMISVYLLSGFPLLIFGLVFGIIKWIKYASLGISAPTGTVILPVMCVLLGFQFLLSAIQIDLQSVPRIPLSSQTKPVDFINYPEN